jgi:Tfp pilus assembly PilM family ATPase
MAKPILNVIEITDTHVKLVQTKKLRGQPVVSHCAIKALHDFTDGEIINTLVNLARSRNVQSDQILFVIPRKFAILKFLHMPSHNIAEIKKMVGLQLVNQIPYALEDVVFDCEVIEKEASGYAQVLAVVVHKEVCQRYWDIFRKAGLQLSSATLSSSGLVNWLNFQVTRRKDVVSGVTAIINIDMVQSEVCFCENGKLIFSRHISYGSKDVDADNFIALMNQIDLSLRAYQNETKRGIVTQIIIVSAIAEIVMLKSRLEHDYKISVRVMTPLENFLAQKNASFPSLTDQPGVSVAVGLGLGMSEPKAVLNLAPQEIEHKKKSQRIKSEWIVFFALLVAVILLIASIPGADYFRQNAKLKRLEEAVKAQDAQVKAAEAKIDQVNALDAEIKGRIKVPDVIAEINRLLLPEISLRAIYLSPDGKLILQGYSQTSAAVNTFQGQLLKSNLFKEMNLEFATKRRIFDVDVVEFKIVSQLPVK